MERPPRRAEASPEDPHAEIKAAYYKATLQFFKSRAFDLTMAETVRLREIVSRSVDAYMKHDKESRERAARVEAGEDEGARQNMDTMGDPRTESIYLFLVEEFDIPTNELPWAPSSKKVINTWEEVAAIAKKRRRDREML